MNASKVVAPNDGLKVPLLMVFDASGLLVDVPNGWVGSSSLAAIGAKHPVLSLGARRHATGSNVPPKYRALQTSTARGEQAKWGTEAVAGGGDLDNLRIASSADPAT